MAEQEQKPMSWGLIVAIMLGTGLAMGLLLGLVSSVLGVQIKGSGAGIGASVGFIGAILIARRRAALAKQNKG